MGWQELHNNRSLLAGSVDVSVFVCYFATLGTLPAGYLPDFQANDHVH